MCLALLLGGVATAGGARSNALANGRSSADCPSARASAENVSLPGAIVLPPYGICNDAFYEFALRRGQFLQIAKRASDDTLNFSLYLLSRNASLCTGNQSGNVVRCPAPQTGRYLLDVGDPGGQHLALAALPSPAGADTVAASCTIAGAPVISANRPQIGAGTLCPSGRAYFRFKVTNPGATLVVTWTLLNQTVGNDVDPGIYLPTVDEFTIGRSSRCGELSGLGVYGSTSGIELCTTHEAGLYLLAVGSFIWQVSWRERVGG